MTLKAQTEAFGNGQKSRQVSRPLKAIAFFCATFLSLVTVVVVLILWGLPWLGRRGDLNALVESAIAGLHPALEVKIDTLETDPLSQLAITFMEGVRTVGSEERFSFRCDRVSLLYNPLDLLEGRLEQLSLARPQVFINLDADLAYLFQLPEAQESVSDDATSQGVGLGHLSIQDGNLILQYASQRFDIADLKVDVYGVGSRDLLSFKIEARVADAQCKVEGKLLPMGAGRLEIRDARLSVEGFRPHAALQALLPEMPEIDHDGRLNLIGTVSGVWPREVSIKLRAAAHGVRVDVEETHWLSKGDARVEFEAKVRGELETAEFRLSASLRAEVRAGVARSCEELTTIVVGGYDKRDGGRVWIDDVSYVALEDFGRFVVDGGVTSLLEAPQLDLRIDSKDGVELDRLMRHSFFDGLRPTLGDVGGSLRLTIAASGPLDDPRMRVQFEAPDVTAASGRLSGDVRGSVAEVSGLFSGAPTFDGVRIRAAGVDLAGVAKLLGRDDLISGNATVVVDIPQVIPPAAPVSTSIAVRVDGVAVSMEDGFIAMTECDGEARWEVAPKSDPTGESSIYRLDGEVTLRPRELAIGPIYELVDGAPIRIQGPVELSFSGSGLTRIVALDFDVSVAAPLTGELALRGELLTFPDPDGAPTRLRMAVSAPAIPNRRFLGVAIRDAYSSRFDFLEGATFDGFTDVKLDMAVVGEDVSASGRLKTTSLSVRLPAVDFLIDDADVDLPFDFGESPKGDEFVEPLSGEIALGALRFGDVAVESLRLPLGYRAGRYMLADPKVSVPLFGGSLDLRALDVGWGGEDWIRAAVAAEGLPLSEASKNVGLRPIPGTIDVELGAIRVASERIELRGSVGVNAFGGAIRLADFSVRDWATPYATFSLGSGSVQDVNLLDLGEAFNFGLVSGILQGSIEDLVFLPDAVSRFRLKLQTVRRPSISQYISPTAIDSIKRAIGGPFATVGNLIFSKFYYEGFGFTASLRNGRFRLHGNFDFDGVEHVMYSRWWHLPRVRMINTRPDRDYDWGEILGYLRQVYCATPAPEQEEQ